MSDLYVNSGHEHGCEPVNALRATAADEEVGA
jgi:hypothetical protein